MKGDQKKLPLAREFCRIVRRDLTKRQVETVVRRNLAEGSQDVCHTHDFCDANMMMDEAFAKVLGRRIDICNDADRKIWNGAWDLAKVEEFEL